MAHWFHRNPLKATSVAKFDLRGIATNGEAQQICNELRAARSYLLEIVANPNNEINVIVQATEKYFGLMYGFIESPAENKGTSKLKSLLKFRWTDTLLGQLTTDSQDTVYEILSMLINVAIWYTKHAAKLAGTEEVSMEDAKEIHKCLRTSSGIFTYVKNEVSHLEKAPEKMTDLDMRVLDSYINQHMAEAQEVTIARAIEMKHSTSIISSLANETSQMFLTAHASLDSFNDKDKVTEKWKKYLEFKSEIYLAYAYNYHGDDILAQDKCGEAIKCLQESQKHYNRAEILAKEYSSTKGPGPTVKPAEHLFFRKLKPIVQRTLDKCIRENGFIYHQKVPLEVTKLELKATYGLAAPIDFVVPTPSQLWTESSYNAFDVAKTPPKDPKAKEDTGNLPAVKETDINQSNRDPKNSSGCIIS